jgi:hypothetical protein
MVDDPSRLVDVVPLRPGTSWMPATIGATT